MEAQCTVEDVSAGPERIVMRVFYPAVGCDALFRWFTVPALLARWWPPEASIEPREGGTFRLSWPAMGWHLSGHYSEFAPGRALAFTWHWEHEPDRPTREVSIRFEPSGGGCGLALTQGDYTQSEADQAERASHVEGWLHFLRRLGQALASVHTDALEA